MAVSSLRLRHDKLKSDLSECDHGDDDVMESGEESQESDPGRRLGGDWLSSASTVQVQVLWHQPRCGRGQKKCSPPAQQPTNNFYSTNTGISQHQLLDIHFCVVRNSCNVRHCSYDALMKI